VARSAPSCGLHAPTRHLRSPAAAYLARTIPGGTLTILPGVSHFAPLQRPARFNAALLAFLDGLPG
jgi:pimeloyl-ACP methyl ester carboxylesterase